MQRMIIWALLLCLGTGLSTPLLADDAFFPKTLTFKVRKGTLMTGQFRLEFTESLDFDNAYLLTMKDFESLGYSSNQVLMSTVRKGDLSLLGHVVRDGGRRLRQLNYDASCKSAIDGQTTSCFRYAEGEARKAMQTEIFTPYKALDLISSMLVAARVAHEPKFEKRDFNFMFNRHTRQVQLSAHGSEKIETPLGKMRTTVLALELPDDGGEIYRFYIGQDKRGSFPVRMVYEDPKEGTVEFIVKSVEWGV